MWPHLAPASPVAMASCLATSGVQSRMPGASVVVRSSAGILNWRYQPCRWQSPSPSQISSWQDFRRTMHPQYVRRQQEFHCCWSACVEQSAIELRRHYLGTIWANTENISVRAVTDHGALWLFCFLCALEVLLLTYSLTPRDALAPCPWSRSVSWCLA